MTREKRKDLITLADITSDEIYGWFDLAKRLKKENKEGRLHPLLIGKTLAMIFQKPSTRTRVSFEAGMAQLGGHSLNLSPNDLQLSRGETIADTAKVLSRYVDAILARVYKHSDIVELAQNASVPVINGLSDFTHPCQGLTDYFSILEKRKSLKGLKLVYVGDGNNVAHSLIFGGAKLGVTVVCVTPKGYEPDAQVLKIASKEAKKTGAKVLCVNDIDSGVKGADVLYTDVWVSMGQEAETEKKLNVFKPYQLNSQVVAATRRKDVLIMHCLPAHRGYEISDEAMDSPGSIIFDQAENRLHVQKALLVSLLR